MDRFLHLIMPKSDPMDSTLYLACSWVLGLVSGTFISFCSGNSLFSAMRAASTCRVSIICLLSAIFLPILFSAFAVYISQLWLLIPIAFSKAFLFGWMAFGVCAYFGCAGWLVRLLLMFADCAMLPVLYWYWYRQLSNSSGFSLRNILCVLTAAIIIGCVDYYVISPFWAEVISF